MEKEYKLVESVPAITQIDLPSGFKSWREEFNEEDVEAFLKEKNFDLWMYDGTCEDGDIFLVSKDPSDSIAEVEELAAIKVAFGAKTLVIEPFDDLLLLVTLSWNH